MAGADLGPGRGCRGPRASRARGMCPGVCPYLRVFLCVCVYVCARVLVVGGAEKYSFKKVTLFPCGCIPLARPFVWAHG